ncbi:MAG TPA: hypothetical protein VGL73_14625 [Caulobacteraceae bacterium]|jgi:hypothetical protein
MLKLTLAVTAALALAATGVAAQPGNAADPIVIRMKPGTDSVRLTGVLRQNVACCTYVFKARAGQEMIWSITGAVTRQVVGYPDGHVDGPGIPSPLPLPASGAYSFAVSPDLMADGAFGRYVLKIRIPPLRSPHS